MEATKTSAITIHTVVNLPAEKVWQFWTEPQHIMQWNNASPDWHTPFAENDVRVDGKFRSTMAARDNSMSFDFEGVYTEVVPQKLLKYRLGDDRTVEVVFSGQQGQTTIKETFDPETQNPLEMQRAGWQAILDNFKKYAEENH